MLEKTFDPAAVEPRIYDQWEASGAFDPPARGESRADETFCIVLPPPNVTGSLHIGHALNHTLQDVLARYHRMCGKRVLWQPGMDHAGIATQMVVERRLMDAQEPSRRELGREEFVKRVWAWKEESGGMILNQDRRLGMSCAWSRERFTMDEGLSAAVRKVFVQLYDDGLIYRAKRLVNWDPTFQTAISDLEVENREINGHMWHFKYPLADGRTYTYIEKDADGAVVLEEERDYISIATTRPETMLGDGAVAVNPSDERYAPIVGTLCEIPVGPKEHRRLIPIIHDDYPDPDFGSGAVKITGAHDFNDYDVAQRNGLPKYRLMDDQAALRSDGASYAEAAARAQEIARGAETTEAEVDSLNLVPEVYRGLDRFEARKQVVADIDAEGLMIQVEDKLIMQPFGDRSGVVIEPMLTDQWFVDAETLAKPAIAAVREGRTRFVPEAWAKTYFNWMENIQPWCVSRQLWWGHRIPVWYGPDGTAFVRETEAEALKAARERYNQAHVTLTQDEDVLDTWFSSALWPFSTLGWPNQTEELKDFYPTSVLVTAHDIIFFWVARMMMQGLHFMDAVPFDDVYIHALVRDEQGQKMSKSKGNVIDPLELADEYGADALRFTLAALAAQGRDIRMSKQRVEGYRNFGTKVWNVTRGMMMAGVARDPDWDPASATLTVNRWIVSEVARTAQTVGEALEAYRFNDAAGAIYRFAWNVLCDWYFELIKPILREEDNTPERIETRACAAWALDQLYAMLHPFSPFITEALWAQTAGDVPRDALLISAPWPALPETLVDPDAVAEMDWLIRFITEIRSLRAEMNVPAAAKIPLRVFGAGGVTRARLRRNGDAICLLARLKDAKLGRKEPEGAVQTVVGEARLVLPIGDVVDLAAERVRLGGEIQKIDKEIDRLVKKLANEKFVARAPEDVVAAEREKQASYETQRDKLKVALERLGPAA